MSRETTLKPAPAFTTCFRAFQDESHHVHRMLRRNGVRSEDVEDLVQEVFLVMVRRWSDYDPQRPLRFWLAGIAFRVAWSHHRRARRELPVGLPDPEDEAAGPEDGLGSHGARALVQRALDSLSAGQRELLTMTELDGVPVREVARTCAVPLFTVYSRLRRARADFAKAIRRMQLTVGA